ncbi:hypothetical protein MNBD_GAMMA01-2249 [hydrothermal vent metagenome]|uniref:ASPIC/UnbV domain-containing protein n=1 Tax=hydrothermal vent metagenome TaxID=652676 RepID=A0A3B0VES5_9ZZZZ
MSNSSKFDLWQSKIQQLTRIALIISVIFFCISCTEKEPDHSNHPTKNKSLFTVSQLDGYINKPDKPFQHYQKFTPEFKIYETLGSGVAVIDIDNDGRHEIFFAQFDKNHTTSVLYKIENDKYIDITQQAGLSNLTAIMGAATADINNDGWEDILIYGYKQLHLMLNIEGKFTKFTLPILPENSFYTSATFFNANNDSYLDLWLSRYVDMDTGKQTICKGGDGLPHYCAPSALPFQPDILLFNTQGTAFIPAPKNIIDIAAAPALGVVAADFNNDNMQDIYVANDGQYNYLFTQQSNGSFIEQAQVKSVASNLAGLKEASMGIAIGDYDNNGLIDLFLTHVEQETNTLYNNESEWFFDVTNRIGPGSGSRALTGFGTGFYDLNGDNWLDLFVVNGRIQPKPYQPREDLTEQFQEIPLLYLNQQGVFDRIENISNAKTHAVGRGLAFVDLDNDGDVDMLSSNNNQQPLIFMNNLNPDQWYGLIIKCFNRVDFGARITYGINNSTTKQTFYRHIHTDGSYASASDSRVILYLNANDVLESIQIQYSNQTIKHITPPLAANQYTTFNCIE